MTEKVARETFNEIMAKAIKTLEIYPNMDLEAVAILACAEIQGKQDYDDVRFAVVYNLVGLKR